MVRVKTILVRGGGQTVNIGDISHTPSLLAVLERHIPEANIILWPTRLDRGVAEMLRRRFPDMRIVRDAKGWRSENPRDDDPTIAEALQEADLMMHSSGPGFGSRPDFVRWHQETGKPYGAYGITLGSGIDPNQLPTFEPSLINVLNDASFIFTRETTSLKAVQQLDLACNHFDFTPDVSFMLDLRNDEAADALMESAGLKREDFICVIPRLRITPYWKIYPERTFDSGEIERRTAINEEHAERDHAKLREAIVAWVRQTGHKVLICPEMSYQVDIIRPLVYDPLPADVKEKVVPLDRYWITDEAASMYSRALAVVSMECHSPLIANSVGRPGVYLRQPQDSWKGQMYSDVGLGDWKIELESASGADLTQVLLEIHADYDGALARVNRAKSFVAEQTAKTMSIVQGALGDQATKSREHF